MQPSGTSELDTLKDPLFVPKTAPCNPKVAEGQGRKILVIVIRHGITRRTKNGHRIAPQG